MVFTFQECSKNERFVVKEGDQDSNLTHQILFKTQKTMSKKLSNAHGIYMEGIRDGNYREAIQKYTGDRYTQHSTGVKDGQAGFIEFFEDFTRRNPERDIQIIRSWEDGQYIFLQAYQNINNGFREWVTTDFFDTDEQDRLIEHWDVISRFNPKTPSGHTTLDGATEITDLDQTEANKKLVREMISNVLMEGGKPETAGKYISAKQFIQHHATLSDGLDAFKEMLLAADRDVFYHEIVLLVGKGNFVSTLCKARRDGKDYAQVDIFRVENGLIVEHWDNAEPVPEVHANGGKF
jgi:predicted SnoaL-like aldol condensation-catalyzing enzyme